MPEKRLIDMGKYTRIYDLSDNFAVLISKDTLSIDINKTGVLMHGSEHDPYSILKHGLLPHVTKYSDNLKSDSQICMCLNSDSTKYSIDVDGKRKNSAVKYAGFFSESGGIYILSERVKKLRTYKERWDDLGTYKIGYAWVDQPIPRSMIIGVITKNLPLIAAVMTKLQIDIPIFTPDGREYQLKLT